MTWISWAVCTLFGVGAGLFLQPERHAPWYIRVGVFLLAGLVGLGLAAMAVAVCYDLASRAHDL